MNKIMTRLYNKGLPVETLIGELEGVINRLAELRENLEQSFTDAESIGIDYDWEEKTFHVYVERPETNKEMKDRYKRCRKIIGKGI